ncbi:ribosomal l28e protein family [Holotrichia oblita]|uniref:Ribosomal l28e protein family n=1 Tax=Holotrichia oblita TaxID=644536 RepID=A0ACB9TXJ0_HOLOL|nr:ribosomal l28e protein family [Holotrichia oblita]
MIINLLLLMLILTEANNLTNLSSYRYNGLVHKKSVGIVDAPDKKGFTVVYKKASKHVALRRASAILRSQKAVPQKKPKATKKTE